MLTFTRLGQVGRLGNQLFQIAFIISFAEKHGLNYKLPYWKYAENFDYDFDFSNDLGTINFDLILKEPGLAYNEEYFSAHVPIMKRGSVNIISGYFQSFKYFDKQKVMEIFKPKELSYKISTNEKCVVISVRRGDFVNHKNYNNIEANQFRTLLHRYFKNYKVFVFTDDYKYCRSEFSGDQYEFFDGLSDIGQLMMMRQFKYFILSNSSFSYWGPMLSNCTEQVWFPSLMFTDLERCDIYNRDYWPNDKKYHAYHNPINKPI